MPSLLLQRSIKVMGWKLVNLMIFTSAVVWSFKKLFSLFFCQQHGKKFNFGLSVSDSQYHYFWFDDFINLKLYTMLNGKTLEIAMSSLLSIKLMGLKLVNLIIFTSAVIWSFKKLFFWQQHGKKFNFSLSVSDSQYHNFLFDDVIILKLCKLVCYCQISALVLSVGLLGSVKRKWNVWFYSGLLIIIIPLVLQQM